MRVYIPTPLRSYTGNRREIECAGDTVAEVLRNLDAQYAGIRFRIISEQDTIREHIKIYVNEDTADLNTPLTGGDEVHIICALSGG